MSWSFKVISNYIYLCLFCFSFIDPGEADVSVEIKGSTTAAQVSETILWGEKDCFTSSILSLHTMIITSRLHVTSQSLNLFQVSWFSHCDRTSHCVDSLSVPFCPIWKRIEPCMHDAFSPHYRAGVMQTLNLEEFIASCKLRIVFR